MINCVNPASLNASLITLYLTIKEAKQERPGKEQVWKSWQQHTAPQGAQTETLIQQSPATCSKVWLWLWSRFPSIPAFLFLSQAWLFRLSVISGPYPMSIKFPCILNTFVSIVIKRILTGTIKSPGLHLKHESNLFWVFLINRKIKHQWQIFWKWQFKFGSKLQSLERTTELSWQLNCQVIKISPDLTIFIWLFLPLAG